MIRWIFVAALSILTSAAYGQQGQPAGPLSPCSAFGTSSGTCAQGGVIAAGGPIGSATVVPIITYNAAGQLTNVSSLTITPAIGTVTGLGTSVATALGVNIGTAGSFLVNGGALGTPSGGTVTNLTGTASININGTVGATTPTTGAFTTISTTGNITENNAAGAAIVFQRSGIPIAQLAYDTANMYFDIQGTLNFRAGYNGSTVASINSTGGISATLTQTSAAQSGTVCYNSSTLLFTYDATLGCLTSALSYKDGFTIIQPSDALNEVVRIADYVGTYTYKLGYGLPEGQMIGYAADRLAEIDDRLVGHSPKDGAVAGARYQQDSSLFAPAIKAIVDSCRDAANDNFCQQLLKRMGKR